MKIKLNKLSLEQIDFHPKEYTDEENEMLNIQNEYISLDPNLNNPIEEDKKVELTNNTSPIERDSLTEVINEISENDLNLDNIKQDINNIDNLENKEEIVVKKALEYYTYKYNKQFITFESFNILKGELNNFKEDFNNDVFATLVQDMENMQSVFDCSIDIIKQRQDRTNDVIRKLSTKELNNEMLQKEYDIGEILSSVDSIQQFSKLNNLESVFITLKEILNFSTVILTKEDNKIFAKLNSDTISELVSVKNDIKTAIKEDKYTELINKRLNSKNGAKYTLYGRILKHENFEIFDSENMYILKNIIYPDYSDEHYYNFKSDITVISELVNDIKSNLEKFEEKTIEELNIYKEKYKIMADSVKTSLFKLQSPTKELTNVLWESLIYIRVYYVTLLHKRLADRLLAQHLLLKLLEQIF